MNRQISTFHIGSLVCLILFFFSRCETPPPAPSVISLIDQFESSNGSEPFRVIVAESRPAAFLLNGSGFSVRMGNKEFTAGEDRLTLQKIIAKGITSGIVIQENAVSTIRLDCNIRSKEKVIIRVQYRKPRSTIRAVSCEFISKTANMDPITLAREGNHIEATLDAPPGGADGIRIHHSMEAGRVLDLTSIILLGMEPPVGRSEQYRIRAFFDRYSGQEALKATMESDNPRSRITRDGEIRDCIRLNKGERIDFSIPSDMHRRELRFHVLPISGKLLGDGVFTISFGPSDTQQPIVREFPQGAAEKYGFEYTIVPTMIAHDTDSVHITLTKHKKGILISEPIAVLSPRHPKSNALNLILIDLDTVRADRLETYGYTERPTTEHLDSLLAAHGFFVFDRAYSPSPWTLPATAKIFASRYLDFHTGSSVPEQYTLLAEVLRAGGYYCAGFTGGGQLALPGFDQGFHEYHYSKNLGKTEDSFPQAEEWLESWRGGSFFLFLHTYEPHWPYIRDHFCKNLPSGRLRDLGMTGRAFPKGVDICTALTREESLFVQAAYDSGIRHASDAVVDFLMLMDRKHLWENTVIIILSDHGEEFWEHFPVFASHAHSLYNELLHVPLMIYAPGTSQGGISHISESVSTVDVAPTAYELLGLAVDSSTTLMDGFSLLPYLHDQAIFTRRPMLAAVKSPGLPKICIVDKGRKLIKPFGHGRHVIEECRMYPEKIEVYDLNVDPGERVDLSERDPPLRESLLAELDSIQTEAIQPLQTVESQVDGPSEELKTQLKRLGYLE